MISTKNNNTNIILISLILISLTAILTFGIDDVSAVQAGNISLNTSQTADIQTVEKNTTEPITNQSVKISTNSSKSNQSSTSLESKNNQKLPDPQIYRNGDPVSRGGHPAGYVFDTIAHAITDAQSGDTIMLEDGAIFYEHITVNKALTFDVFNNGHATIDGTNNGRIVIISVNSITVIFNDITFTNGRVNGNGGAIYNNYAGTTLILNNCDFISNAATNNNRGGAIYSAGPLTVNNCNFTSNSARDGGAIWSGSTLTVTGSTFETNTATRNGGAIYNNAGNSNITSNNFISNSATSNGGAIYNANGVATIQFNRIIGNTPNNNQIRRNGGTVNAQYNWWGSNDSPSGKTSGTVADTIWLVLTVTASPTTIFTSGTSTVTADLTHDQNGNYYDPASGHVPDGIFVTFDLSPSSIGSLSSSSGTTTDGSAVTIFTGNSNSGTATVNATVDTVVQSAAITVVRTDVYVSTTGSDTTGDGSPGNPYQTISKGISMVYPGGTVHVLSGTYTGTNNKNIAISKNVNIVCEGGTVTINAQSTSNIFTINSGYTVTLSNFTLTNGNAAIGGAISNGGTLTVTNCTFTDNTATNYGGAISNTGTLTVTNCTFTDNTATNYGGAIENYQGTLTVSGSNFTGNTASSGGGGAIDNWEGNSSVSFSRIVDNGIYYIYNYSGTVNAENNWWGSNDNPSSNVYGTVDVNPWLILTITAVPNSISKGSNSNLTAYLTINSNGHDTSSQGHVPDGITVTFGSDSLGNVNPAANTTINGHANSTFTAGNTIGIAIVSAAADGVTVYTNIIIGCITDLVTTNTIAYEDSVSYLYDTGLYHITVHNNGPDDATGVKVAINIPSGFQLLAVNPIVGTYDNSTNTWTIGNLCYNGTAYLDLILKVIQSGTSLTVTANATGNEEDPNTSNNVANKTVNILKAADLQVTQTVTNNTPNTGSNITSTVTIKNNGPDTANNIIIYYKPPTGLNIVNITPSVGSYDPTTGYWTINSLSWNGTATVTITATVTAPSGTIIKNIARIVRTDEINFSYNNANTAVLRVGGVSYTPQTDLEIYNYYYNIDQDSVNGVVQRNLSDTAMFYVDLHNKGPDDATGVKVTLTIPAGYYILSVNPKIGTFDYNTNTWTIDTLSSGGWALLDYILKVIQSNTTLNSTVNATANETDTNSTNNNESTVINVPPAADLQVNQTVNNTHPTQGSTITYTITVINNGPDTANNVAISYVPPAGLNITSITPSGETTYNSTTGEWIINSLGVGGSATLTITATVTAPSGTIIKSIATKIKEDETDPNLTEISKTAYLQVQ